MSKKYAMFLSCLFCAFIGVVFLANLLTPDKDFSQVENRSLAQQPTLKLSDLSPANLIHDKGAFYTGKFMSDYETYVTDQFVLRDSWVAAKAWSERLLGKKENNGVYFCADGSLITRFDKPGQSRVESNIAAVSKLADKLEVPVTFGLIPTQACVWAHKLPDGAPNADQKAYIDLAAAQTTAQTVNLYDTMMAHLDEPIFYRTDHHWTSLGAYYGYTALADALGYDPVPLDRYTKTTVSTDFYGTVYSTSGVRWVAPDEMDVYVPETGDISVVTVTADAQGNSVEEPRALYDESYLAVKDKYAMFLGGQQSLGIIRTGLADAPKLLLVRDSYSDSLAPFLTAHFSEIHLIDLRYYKASVSDYVAQNHIDQVLVLYSVPNFVTDANFPFLR